MSLSEHDLSRLKRAIAAAASPPLQKILYSPYRLLYSKYMEKRCQRHASTHPAVATTFWGDSMNVLFPEHVSLTIYRYGFFEIDLTYTLHRYLTPGMTFFDVGSHFGYFSLLASHLVGPQGRVHTFEPTPSTFAMVQRNLARKPNVTLINAAAFSTDSTLTFNDFGIEFSAFNSLYSGKLEETDRVKTPPKQVQVSARSLDSYVRETGVIPNFLKIDTEGAELEVIAGMGELLDRHRPMLSLETGDKAWATDVPTTRRCVDAVLLHGYRAVEFRNGSFVEHTPQATYDYGNLLMLPKEQPIIP